MVLIIPKQFRASFQPVCNQIIWKSGVWGSLTELHSVYFKAASLPPVFPITATTGELSSSVTEFAKGLISHVLQPLLVAHFLRRLTRVRNHVPAFYYRESRDVSFLTSTSGGRISNVKNCQNLGSC